jgi:hypothetical protein
MIEKEWSSGQRTTFSKKSSRLKFHFPRGKGTSKTALEAIADVLAKPSATTSQLSIPLPLLSHCLQAHRDLTPPLSVG